MKITVLGSGAMGGLFGAYLSKHNDVTLIDAKPDLVDAVNASGMRVREPDGSVTAYRPKAALSSSGATPSDLVIVFVKSMFAESALSANKDAIGPDTYVMTLQNGAGHEYLISKFVSGDHIIIGTTQHNANISEPGVSNHGGSGMTYLGCVSGDVSRLQHIADTFTACGLEAAVSSDAQKMIWNKMFTNVSASALTAVFQEPLGFITGNAHAWTLCRRLIREAVDVASKMGMDFDYDTKVSEVKAICENSPDGLTSIYADLKNGRLTEVDTISGSIVSAGKKCGVPTPSHELIVELIHAMEGKTRQA